MTALIGDQFVLVKLDQEWGVASLKYVERQGVSVVETPIRLVGADSWGASRIVKALNDSVKKKNRAE